MAKKIGRNSRAPSNKSYEGRAIENKARKINQHIKKTGGKDNKSVEVFEDLLKKNPLLIRKLEMK